MNTRSSESTDTVKYFVLDVDCCALTNFILDDNNKPIPNPREDILSPQVVNEGKNGGYAGFYICTRRAIWSTFIITFADNNLRKHTHFDPKNLTLTFVVQNLEKALGIPCIAVSTGDDLSPSAPAHPAEKCGYGYNNMMKPLEQKLMEINQDLLNQKSHSGYRNIHYSQSNKHKPTPQAQYSELAKNKNPQLKHITDHVSALHPHKKIHLSYWDDEKYLCDSASTMSPDLLSDKITLHVTQHDTYYGLLQFVGSVKGARNTPSMSTTSSISRVMEIDLASVNFQEQQSVTANNPVSVNNIIEAEKSASVKTSITPRLS